MINGNRTKSERGRSPRDLYITPLDLADAAMSRLREDEELGYFSPVVGLDAGCGTGVWGQAAVGLWYATRDENVDADIDGIDIEPGVESFSQYYCSVIKDDFISHDFGKRTYDVVFGNPPFSLAEEFIRKSFEILEPDGCVYFLLRLSFLEGIKRYNGIFKEFPLKRVYVCSRRPSFFSAKENRHPTDTLAYAMFLWRDGYEGVPEISFLNWDYK